MRVASEPCCWADLSIMGLCVCWGWGASAKPISVSEPESSNLVTPNWCNRNAIETRSPSLPIARSATYLLFNCSLSSLGHSLSPHPASSPMKIHPLSSSLNLNHCLQAQGNLRLCFSASFSAPVAQFPSPLKVFFFSCTFTKNKNLPLWSFVFYLMFTDSFLFCHHKKN